jgi:segregation and condensation protein B
MDNMNDENEVILATDAETSELILTTDELIAAEIEAELISPELLWEARTGLNADTLCGAIETIIFMSDRPISIVKIKSLIDDDIPLKIIHESLQRLQNEYEEKHHGIRLLEVAEGYQYRTKATYSKYVQDIFKINSLVLSPTALEVLAIIAYKQPVSKVEVDKIRGVDSGHIVRALIDKRLVKVSGRSEEVGRPVLYSTTPEFLEVFNLADISQLPPEHELDEMSKASSVGKIADIKTLVHDGDKAKFKFDEIDELDQLSEAIKNISADTAFTASLKVEEKKRLNAEGEVIKSAFDLLEEFVNKRVISEQNKKACESQLTTNVIDPKVISNLEAGPFNVPNLEEEEFEMIDLDTGLSLSELEEIERLQELLNQSENIDLNFDSEASSEEALSKALDAAFLNLTGNDISTDDFNFGEELVQMGQEITDLTESMVAKANDLDLDLSFLNDNLADIDKDLE